MARGERKSLLKWREYFLRRAMTCVCVKDCIREWKVGVCGCFCGRSSTHSRERTSSPGMEVSQGITAGVWELGENLPSDLLFPAHLNCRMRDSGCVECVCGRSFWRCVSHKKCVEGDAPGPRHWDWERATTLWPLWGNISDASLNFHSRATSQFIAGDHRKQTTIPEETLSTQKKSFKWKLFLPTGVCVCVCADEDESLVMDLWSSVKIHVNNECLGQARMD